ncbi:pilus assembly PilX family protein [Piscinibacter sakaiensis]|uniref:pilus assembly PilX family protein n=1 Tax=Piscinibacter sakaiensis TaxID=1547922 RepID=UPI003AAC5666
MKSQKFSPHRMQRGVSLLFALITLVALSLAAVALVRSVNTSSLIVGNLGFKQDSIAYASQAAEEAIDFLNLNKKTGALFLDIPDSAYYATAHENLDPANRRPTGDPTRAVVDWAGDACATGYEAGSFGVCLQSWKSVSGPSGNQTRYTITRLCTQPLPDNDAANSCAKPVRASLTESGEKGSLAYPGGRPADVIEGGPYYRVIVRSVGARNAVSITETIVHF